MIVLATQRANQMRMRHGIPPVRIDPWAAYQAQIFLEQFIFGFSFRGGRRRLEDINEEEEECGRSVYKNTDPNVKEVTIEMAV